MAIICNQLCTWNDPSDGCVKPRYEICPISNVAAERKPMTNADRIRVMSDEELRKFMCSITKCEVCRYENWGGCGLMEWLQQPV